MSSRLKNYVKFYRIYINKTVRSKKRFFNLVLRKKDSEITFYNGLRIRFSKGEVGKLVKITKGLYFLNKYEIRSNVVGSIFFIHTPSESLEIDLNKISKGELSNLLMMVYYCIRYDTMLSTKKSVLLDEVVPHMFLDLESRTILINDKICFNLEDIDPWIIVETFILGIHYKFKGLSKAKSVLDAGAAFGDTALFFSSKGMRVYAVEPIKTNFDTILSNLKLNKELAKKVYPIHAAIGNDSILKFKFERSIVDGSATAFLQHITANDVEEVRSYSVDTLCKELKLDKIDYLKMDCKGAEFLLTEKDLLRVNKFLKIEYTTEKNGDLEKLINLIQRSGFVCSISKNSPDDELPISHHGTIYAVRGFKIGRKA